MNRKLNIFLFTVLLSVICTCRVFAQIPGMPYMSFNAIPPSITLAQNQKYFVASVYDRNYLPYTAPTTAATTSTLAPDGTNEAVTLDIQGVISTTGVTILMPVTATDNGILQAYSTTVVIPAAMTEDGNSRSLTLSWAAQAYTSSTKTITATLAAVGGTLNAKKLDINAGIGNDYLGVLLGTFSYPYNNAGNTTTLQVRDIPGIPDKMFGKADNTGSTTSHNFLYVPVMGEDGNIWLNNNLGADYANVNSASFAPVTQATSPTDYLAYGSLFQWGRKPDGHELVIWKIGTESATNTTVNSTIETKSNTPTDALFITASNSPFDWRITQSDALWATEVSANNPCPNGFRVPTNTEQRILYTAAGITNNATAASSKLKFSVAGYRYYGNGVLNFTGVYGCYWSSSVNETNASHRDFSSSTSDVYDHPRAIGLSIRCLKDTPASIGLLNCADATNSGTLTQGAAASGVASVIPYTGGNGGVYDVQTIASTGVPGLTATLANGQLATGAGTLTYTITGTPAGNGTASFAISIGGQSCTLTMTVAPIVIPSSMTLSQSQKYFVASVYDTDYLPYTAPTTAASTSSIPADGTAESVTANVQGSIATTGVKVFIPVTATASGTLPAYLATVTIPAAMTEDGNSRSLTLSWAAQAYTSSTKTITATLAAVGGTLNAKKLDINAGIGNDYLGVLLGTFSYPYNNVGNTTTLQVRDIPGIPDKMFGKADNTGSTTSHNFLYVPVTCEDGNIWLNNNLGADYANVNSASFAPAMQATGYQDYHAYGSLFQWCRKPDGHELIAWTSATAGTGVSGTTSTLSTSTTPGHSLFIANTNSPLNDWLSTQQIDGSLWWNGSTAGANNPCPVSYHVPTYAEWSAELPYVTNATTAYNVLKLTLPGVRYYGDYGSNGIGYVVNPSVYGYFWSNTVTGNNSYCLYINSTTTFMYNDGRADGFSVRCIKD